MKHTFGGANANGAWHCMRAYEAGEVALVLYLQNFGLLAWALAPPSPPSPTFSYSCVLLLLRVPAALPKHRLTEAKQ